MNVRYQREGRRLGRHQLERTVPHTWYDEGSRWQVGALHSALSGDHMDADLPSSIPLCASHNLHLCSAVHHLAWAQSKTLENSKKEIKLGTSTNTTKERERDCGGWSLPFHHLSAETPVRHIKGPLNPTENSMKVTAGTNTT